MNGWLKGERQKLYWLSQSGEHQQRGKGQRRLPIWTPSRPLQERVFDSPQFLDKVLFERFNLFVLVCIKETQEIPKKGWVAIVARGWGGGLGFS